MVKDIQYKSIKEVVSNLMDHPMLSDLTVEQAVRYVIRFIGLHGYNALYEDKIVDVEIHEFRGLLPCDLISVIQVKDLASGICLRSMTDNFNPGLMPPPPAPPKDLQNNMRAQIANQYIPPRHHHEGELTFKTSDRVIFTSFPEGCVQVAYKAIPVDENGFPLLIDNEIYMAALEAFIKQEKFNIKFDQGKIPGGVLQNAQQTYAWRAKQLEMEMIMPSQSEMESISRMLTTLIPRVREFDNGFTDMGNREYIRKHNNRY